MIFDQKADWPLSGTSRLRGIDVIRFQCRDEMLDAASDLTRIGSSPPLPDVMRGAEKPDKRVYEDSYRLQEAG